MVMQAGMRIVQTFVEKVREQGGDIEDVQYLATPEGEQFLAKVASRLMAHRRYLRQFPKPRVNNIGYPPVGKPFTTVVLGTRGSYDDYRDQIVDLLGRDIEMPKGDFDAIFSESISQKIIELDLYEVTGAELGFSQAEYAQTIWAELKKRGFAPCPAEAALAALVRYHDEDARKFYMERPDLFRAGALVFLGLRSDGKGKHLSVVEDRIPFKPSRKWIAVWPRVVPESPGFLF